MLNANKQCAKCKQIKTIDQFRYRSAPRQHLLRSWCNECEAIHKKEWHIKNKKEQNSKSREYYSKNKDNIAQTHVIWKTNNKAKLKEYSNKRNLRKVKWADHEAIKAFYDNCPPGYHVDHIIPLCGKDISGLHVLSNLQYLPGSINLTKANILKLE